MGGCPNNCVKPDLNDVGIVGQRIPRVIPELCKGCKLCEKSCPLHVAKVVDGKAVIDPAQCNNCGRCIPKCPFQAIEAQATGYQVYIGGRWGKRTAMGRPLSTIFTNQEELLTLIENVCYFSAPTANPRSASPTPSPVWVRPRSRLCCCPTSCFSARKRSWPSPAG